MTNSSQQPALGAWTGSSPAKSSAPASRDHDDEKVQKKPVAKTSVFTAPGGPPGMASSSAEITVVHAPVAILYGSLAASLVGLVLAALAANLVLGALAWSLSALVGLGLTGFFLLKDAGRQAQTHSIYARGPLDLLLYRASIALALLVIVVAAVRIAFIVGRM